MRGLLADSRGAVHFHQTCHRRRRAGCASLQPRAFGSSGGGTVTLKNGVVIDYWSRPDVPFLSNEVFVERAYTQHGVTVKPGDRVIDIGANIGLARRVRVGWLLFRLPTSRPRPSSLTPPPVCIDTAVHHLLRLGDAKQRHDRFCRAGPGNPRAPPAQRPEERFSGTRRRWGGRRGSLNLAPQSRRRRRGGPAGRVCFLPARGWVDVDAAVGRRGACYAARPVWSTAAAAGFEGAGR